MDIAQRLKQVRKSKNISVYKLSQTSGVSEKHIHDLDCDDRNPSLDTLSRLAMSLGLSLPDLLNENREVSYLTDKEKEFVEYFRMLSDDKADALLKFLKTII